MEVTRPDATLRGHTVGVTALCYTRINGMQCLISGDTDGTLILWNLDIFRHYKTHLNICHSRVQSLRLISLNIRSHICDILVVQSRDDGIMMYNLTELYENDCSGTLGPIEKFETYTSLFSRCDAKNLTDDQTVIAYPSSAGRHIVALRYLGDEAKTLIAGSALRMDVTKSQQTFSVFDICLMRGNESGESLVFIAYEDGCMCCYRFGQDSTTTVAELGAKGLKINLIVKCDTQFQDFISAYDVIQNQSNFTVICGGPKKELARIYLNIPSNGVEPSIDKIRLRRQGIGALSFRSDHKVFAAAGWDNNVGLYHTETSNLLINYVHHLNQVQDILFFKNSKDCDTDSEGSVQDSAECSKINYIYSMCCASLDGTISVFKSNRQ